MKNKDVIRELKKIYSNLAKSINAAANLEQIFREQKDDRKLKAEKIANLIMIAQEIANSMAEDEDISLI